MSKVSIKEKKILGISIGLSVGATGCLLVTGYMNNMFYTIPSWVDSVSSFVLVIAIIVSGFGVGYAVFAMTKVKGWYKTWPIVSMAVCILVLLFAYVAYWMGGY